MSNGRLKVDTLTGQIKRKVWWCVMDACSGYVQTKGVTKSRNGLLFNGRIDSAFYKVARHRNGKREQVNGQGLTNVCSGARAN